MEETFSEKPNETHYKLVTNITQGLTIYIILLFLYFYLLKAKSIYYFLHEELIGYLSSSVFPAIISSETAEIVIGLLSTFFVFFLLPGLSIFFAWKTIRYINSHRRKKYEYQRLKSGDPVENSIPENIFIIDSYKAHVDLKELFERAKRSYAAGNYQEAISIFSEAIILCSNHKAYYNRAILYYKIGKKKRAMSDLKKAAKLGHEESQILLAIF